MAQSRSPARPLAPGPAGLPQMDHKARGTGRSLRRQEEQYLPRSRRGGQPPLGKTFHYSFHHFIFLNLFFLKVVCF